MKTLILPIDDRPVTCLFPQMVAKLAGADVLAPPREILGALTRPADPDALIEWVDSALAKDSPDAMLLCLDSLLYGGLVNSRRSSDTVKQVLGQAGCLARWRKTAGPSLPVLGQASIMRISDNYDATEEKPYWSRYGKEIFQWSGLLHQLARGDELAPGVLSNVELKIPAELRSDYLQTRQRNFQVNQSLLSTDVMSGNLDFLVFSLDDSGATGLNLLEKERLLAQAQKLGLADRVMAYPGADEVILSLLSRLLVRQAGVRPRAGLIYSPSETEYCSSRYEGQPVGRTVAAQLNACAIEPVPGQSADSDFIVLIHGQPTVQGDHILLPGEPDFRSLNTGRSVAQTLETLDAIEKPCILCDVAYANGADPALVEALLDRPELLGKLWAYAGWNTTGNTVGSALAMGVARWLADRRPAARFSPNADMTSGSSQVTPAPGSSTPVSNSPNSAVDEALKRCLFIRLADDWAYQAVVRKSLTAPADPHFLKSKLDPQLRKIARALDYHPTKVELRHPWQRTFEIEVAL